jgi:methyl halide transferase
MSESPSDTRYWQSQWERPTQGWDIGRAAPPLVRWFGAHAARGRRVLVPGCGRGHEARLLAAEGADVVAVDFAPGALAEARALAAAEKLHIDFRQRDLFTLAEDPERYDLVVEHCCFCAIEPARRAEYLDVIADVLVEGGELVGLYWNHGRPGGPPFSVDDTELKRLFERRFVLRQMSVPDDSIERRRGQEILAQLYRR